MTNHLLERDPVLVDAIIIRTPSEQPEFLNSSPTSQPPLTLRSYNSSLNDEYIDDIFTVIGGLP
jgi:hypothetical protein